MARVAGHGRAGGAGQGSGWGWWCRWRAGWWLPGIGGSRTGCSMRRRWRSVRPGRISVMLQAAGRSELTIRSYGMDLLRWFRFLWAAGVAWDRATRAEARDFCRWLLVAGKPVAAALAGAAAWGRWPGAGVGRWRMRRRCGRIARRCCAAFMTFIVEAGTGPLVNPFPLDRSRRGGRAHAHRNPMEPYRRERSGLYRPGVPSRIPRSVPDEEFNAIFAALRSHRDRALVAFYVSTGARASELLSATRGGVDPGRQLITVVRKGTGRCSICLPRRMRSCGCGCISWRRRA